MPAAVQQLQRGVPTIGDGHDLAFRVPAPYQKEHLPGPLGERLMTFAALFSVTLGVGQDRKKRQRPHPRSPRNLRQERHAYPSEGARFDEVGVAGADRITVDPFRGDPLSPAAFKGLVYAHNQRRSFGYEGFHQQLQQDAAGFLARPYGTAEHPVVAMELLLLVQAHRFQGRTHRPFARSEDRTREQHLHMLEDSLGEKWREWGQNPYHHGR